jgi:hypothetical protein
VEAHGDPEAGGDVADREDGQVDPLDRATPEHDHRKPERPKRQDDRDEVAGVLGPHGVAISEPSFESMQLSSWS